MNRGARRCPSCSPSIHGGVTFLPDAARVLGLAMRFTSTLFLLPLLLAGCTKPADTTVTAPPPPPVPPDVQTAIAQRGKAIAMEAFSLLSSNLQSALQAGGVTNAIPFCSLAASPLTSGIATQHGVRLRRVTHKARQPAAQADPQEAAILESFQAALRADTTTNPPPPIVTNLLAGHLTFFAPIVLNHDLCLQCHGEPGGDVTFENLAVIRRLYPHDQAVGFQRGQLRGAWRIDFPNERSR